MGGLRFLHRLMLQVYWKQCVSKKKQEANLTSRMHEKQEGDAPCANVLVHTGTSADSLFLTKSEIVKHVTRQRSSVVKLIKRDGWWNNILWIRFNVGEQSILYCGPAFPLK